MNKNLYRIVYNAARGMLMVVAENAGSGSGGGQQGRGVCPAAARQKGQAFRLSALHLCLLLAAGGITLPARAGFEADPQAPGHQQPVIIESANGVAQIDIQSPDEHGLSHNVYRQFDVDPSGVILNNSHQSVQTELGGYIDGNPEMARGSASVILNEINSSDPSHLNGWIEVAGQRAEVVIANPAGITCDGCGFINAHNATLAAGQAVMKDGRLEGFDVHRGELVFEGHPSNLNVSHATLIARAVRVNTELQARELTVTIGRNRTDTRGNVTEAKGDDGHSPRYALDVAALGGMYAHKIQLIGNERGLGVHNAGNIGASIGEFSLTVDGRLENSGAMTGHTGLHLTAGGDVDNTGKMASNGDIRLQVVGGLHNDGRVAARNTISVEAGRLRSGHESIWSAGHDEAGNAVEPGDLRLQIAGEAALGGTQLTSATLTVNSTSLDMSGSRTKAKKLALKTSRGEVRLSGASVNARQLDITSASGINNDGGTLVAEQMVLKAGHLSNQRGHLQQTGAQDLVLKFISRSEDAGPVRLAENTARNSGVHGPSGPENDPQASEARDAAGTLNNVGGLIDTAGSMRLNVDHLVNSGGKVLAAGDTSAIAKTISNRAGQLHSGGHAVVDARTLDNQGGRIQASGHVRVSADTLNNTDDGRIVTNNNAEITSTSLYNTAGWIDAAGNLNVASDTLTNSGGRMHSIGNADIASVHHLDNRQGEIHAASIMVNAGALNNTGGHIRAAVNLSVITGALDNTNGKLFSTGTHLLTVGYPALTGAYINHRGFIQGGQGLAIDLGQGSLDNRDGTLQSLNTLSVKADALLNGGGQIAMECNSTLLINNRLDNSSGNIQGNDVLTINATEIINTDTRQQNKGIQSPRLQIAARRLNNVKGALRAEDRLDAILAETLDNRQGLISAEKILTIRDNDHGHRLAANNDGGKWVAGEQGIFTLRRLTGIGLVRSLKDLVIHLQDDLHIAGEVEADGDLTLHTAGGITNEGRLTALGTLLMDPRYLNNGVMAQLHTNNVQLSLPGELNNKGQMHIGNGQINAGAFNNAPAAQFQANDLQLSLPGALNNHGQMHIRKGRVNAGAFNNAPAAEIQANDMWLSLRGKLENTGLLDFGLARLDAEIFANIGSGRLYGDHIALRANRLENHAREGRGAVIAARERLDIGADHIDNRNRSEIMSIGDMSIGGGLDAHGRATGRAGRLDNHDADISAAGSLSIAAGAVTNTNGGLILAKATRSEARHEGMLKGQNIRYDWERINTRYKNKYGVHDAIMPDGSRDNTFYEYIYTRTITEDRIEQNRPARILAGGAMTFDTDSLHNQDSQITAGGQINGHIGESRNEATDGERITTDQGTQMRWYEGKKKRKCRKTKTFQGKNKSSYRPGIINESIPLKALVWQEHTRADVVPHDMAAPRVGLLGLGFTGKSSFTERWRPTAIKPPIMADGPEHLFSRPLDLITGQVYEHPLSPDVEIGGAWTPVVRVMAPEIRLPASSLFTLHPGPVNHYLVETDPRFTRYKQWLGSDYMQTKLAFNPNLAHKRLGDGFYEQRLVRDQIIQLTGQRHLPGHHDDNEQFKALMNAGVHYAEKYQLTPGVMLSPSQMALLTSDMVWLINQTVTLDDGSTQQVLVPQVYARTGKGDLTGDGALLSGRSVRLNVNGDLDNSGTLAARETMALIVDNFIHSGQTKAKEVEVQAKRDIRQTGGRLMGGDRLSLLAGQDIRIQSTLRGDGENRWLDRPAGIYVENPHGTLELKALNNIDLTAVDIANKGINSRTAIAAGNNLTLDTLLTASRNSAYWGHDNYRLSGEQRDVGSRLNSGGEISLSAGSDFNARAAYIDAAQHLGLYAGRDIFLTSGAAESHVTEHSKQSSSGFLSKMSLETHDEVHRRQALGALLSGDTVQLTAGRDVSVSGGNIAGTGDISLAAGNHLTLTTAEETHFESHFRQEKKSGLMSSGGIGFSVGKDSLRRTNDTTIRQHKGTVAGSERGNTTLSAGGPLTVHGSDVIAGGDIALSGSDVELSAAENSIIEHSAMEQKRSSFTVALSDFTGSALKNTVKNFRQAEKNDKGRLSSLYRTKAASNAAKAEVASGLSALQNETPLNSQALGFSLSYGSQSARSEQRHERYQAQGSTLSGGGTIAITAAGPQGNGDITLRGGTLETEQDIILNAVRDIHLFSVLNRELIKDSNSGKTNKNMTTAKSARTHDEIHVSRACGTQLSGDSISLMAGRDLLVSGGEIAATGDVTLTAGNHLTLTTIEETHHESHLSEGKNAGQLDSGGIGIMVGKEGSKQTSSLAIRQQKSTVVGSERGHTRLEAGGRLDIIGSSLIAGQDIHVSAADIDISATENHSVQSHNTENKRSGLTLGLSGTVGSAINNVVQNIQQAEKTDNPRMAALQRIKTALSGVQAVGAGILAAAQDDQPQNNNAIGVSLSLGSQISRAEQRHEQRIAQGSTVDAGGSIVVTASGQEGTGNLTVEGGKFQARQDISLNASRDIHVLSAANHKKTEGSNSSRGGMVGVGIGVGRGGWGISVLAGINKGKGSELGNGTFHTNTLLDAGRQIRLASGRDAVLAGAQVNGETIKADIGRNLLLQSRQDSDNYDAKQQDASASGQFTWGSMTGSGSANVRRSKLHSTYNAVQEQTGIFAGRGGVDVRVGEHTQLDGAVIGSTASVDRNQLETGTLGFSDIHNHAEFKTEQINVGMSSGGPMDCQFFVNLVSTLWGGGNRSGSSTTTTEAAFSPGSLIIRNPQDQQQDIAALSRDVEHAHETLSPIFNKEKEQQRLQQVALLADIGNQIIDIARTGAAISATRSASQAVENASEEDIQAARASLAKEGKGNQSPTDKQVRHRLHNNAYNKALAETGLGIGGRALKALTAVNGVAQGLANGNVGQALAGAAAPYVAEEIKSFSGDNDTLRLTAHAIAGAALAKMQGSSALAGGAGALSAEAAAKVIAERLYPGKAVSELTEGQKAAVSAASTLVGGLAGGLTGNGLGDAVAGAQAGKNAVENNFLTGDDGRAFEKEWADCKASGGDCGAVVDKYAAINAQRNEELQQVCEDSPLTCASYQKQLVDTGMDAATRPEWMPDWFGAPIRDGEIRGVVQTENAQALEYIHKSTDNWDRLGSFVAEPENVLGLAGTAKSFLASSATTTAKATGAALSLGANAGMQIYDGKTGDKFDYASLLTAGVSGAAGVGKSLNSNVRLNVGGAYMSSQVNGEDSQAAMMGAALGAGVGYGVGTAITRPWESKLVKEHFGMSASKNALKYSETTFGPGYLFKESNISAIPGISGGFVGAGTAEASNGFAQQQLKKVKE